MARVGRIWLPPTCHNVATSVKRARGTRERVGFCGERRQPVGGTVAENKPEMVMLPLVAAGFLRLTAKLRPRSHAVPSSCRCSRPITLPQNTLQSHTSSLSHQNLESCDVTTLESNSECPCLRAREWPRAVPGIQEARHDQRDYIL